MKYQRLPGKWRFFFCQHTLWMGDDHLLAVKSYGYSEHYSRYYFKDILAITTNRTNRSKVWNAVLGTMLGFALICLAVSLITDTFPMIIVGGVFSSLFLIALIINIRRGPTCRCHILTTLGIRELPSVKRTRWSEKVMDTIRPRILDNQGTVSQESITVPSGSATGAPLLHVGAGELPYSMTGEYTLGVQLEKEP